MKEIQQYGIFLAPTDRPTDRPTIFIENFLSEIMRFKIRTKLLIAFLVIIFPFIVIVGAIALYNTMTIRNASLKIEAISEELHTVLSLQLAIDKSLMPGNDYIITGDKRYIDEFNDASKDVEDLIEKVEKILVVLGGMDTPEVKEEMEILKSVKTAWQNIKEASQKIFEIPNPVGNKEAAGLMEEMDYKWAYPAIKMLDSYHEIDRKEHTEAIEELYRAWILAWVIMIGGAVLLITFGVFFAIFYSRLFTRPIETIHNGADAIAKGDFKVRLDIKTGDEIEQLSKAMNEMAKQLDTLYLNMGEKIEDGIRKFTTITESANDAIIVLSSPDVIHFWNKKAEEIFGYKIDEVVGKSVHDLVVPQKFRDKAKGGLDNFFKTGKGPVVGKVVEVFGVHKDGREFPIELSVSAVKIGEEWQAIGIIRDITERKKAEEIIREKEQRYRSLFENMMDGFAHCRMLFDEQNNPVDFVYLDVNKSFEQLMGLKNVVGKKVTEVIPGIKESHPELFDIYGRVALTGKSERFEIHFKPLAIWLFISVYSPKQGYFVAVFDNITERKKSESELMQRIEELEQFRKVTIQRELRMEELKRRNKELEEELKILRGMR